MPVLCFAHVFLNVYNLLSSSELLRLSVKASMRYVLVPPPDQAILIRFSRVNGFDTRRVIRRKFSSFPEDGIILINVYNPIPLTVWNLVGVKNSTVPGAYFSL